MGRRQRLIQPIVTTTLSKSKTREKSVRKVKPEQGCEATTCKLFLFLGCLLVVSPLYLFSLLFPPSRRNGFTILYALLTGQIDTSEVKTTWFYIVVIKCYLNKSEHTSVLIHLTNTAYKLCWICSVLKLHYCLFMMHFSYLQQRRHCNDFCWQPRENCI